MPQSAREDQFKFTAESRPRLVMLLRTASSWPDTQRAINLVAVFPMRMSIDQVNCKVKSMILLRGKWLLRAQKSSEPT